MISKEKIVSHLKKIGIAIAAFVGILLFSKLHVLLKKNDEKKEERIKDTISDIKDDIDETKDVIKKSNDTIKEIKSTIEKASNGKDEIVSHSIDNRVSAAKKAGFKKK
jgi:gas vesicle protein